MVRLEWRAVELRTARPFKIATGTTTRFETVVVRARDGGHEGWGEAQPAKRVTGEDLDTVDAFLRWVAREIEPLDARGALDWLACTHVDVCGNPAARCGADLALHDLVGRKEGRHARELYGLPPARLATSFTVSLDAPDVMAAEAMDHLARGFTVLKLKLGGKDGLDAARVAAVRHAVSSRARLRADANTAWSHEEAPRLCRELSGLGVELVEQPFPAQDLDALARLSRASPVPVYADESCLGPDDVPRLLAHGFVGGVNLKLQKTGGLGPAVEAARAAREAGLGVMLGCMLETGCGIAGGRQMLALLDHADLDGNVLLSEDPFATEIPRDGVVETPRGPGLGARPVRALL